MAPLWTLGYLIQLWTRIFIYINRWKWPPLKKGEVCSLVPPINILPRGGGVEWYGDVFLFSFLWFEYDLFSCHCFRIQQLVDRVGRGIRKKREERKQWFLRFILKYECLFVLLVPYSAVGRRKRRRIKREEKKRKEIKIYRISDSCFYLPPPHPCNPHGAANICLIKYSQQV